MCNTTFTLQKWAKPNHAGPAGLTFMTVYTVKQTGLTHAGPQKCASVNIV